MAPDKPVSLGETAWQIVDNLSLHDMSHMRVFMHDDM